MAFIPDVLERKLRSLCNKGRGNVTLAVHVEADRLNWECSVEIPVPADALEWLWEFGGVTGLSDKDVIRSSFYRLFCDAIEFLMEKRNRRPIAEASKR